MDVKVIAKNISVSGIAQVITSGLAFSLLIYTARYLGTEEFGKYSFALSFTALFMVFADIGINQFIIRELARNEKLTNEYITNVSLIKILLSFVALILIVLAINLMKYPQNTRHIVELFGIYTVLTSLGLTYKSIFQAHEKLEHTASVTIIIQILLTSLVLFALFSGYGLTELAYIYVISGICDVLLSFFIVVMKIAKPKFVIDLSLWKKLIIGSAPFALNSLFAVLFFRIDTIMLSIIKNDTAVGIYNAAYTPLLAVTGIISQMVISALYPVMSKSFVDFPDSLKALTIMVSKYMAIIGFPIAIGCFVLADRFIELLYAGQYSTSIHTFQILSLFIPIRLVSGITGTLLASINRQPFRTFSVGLSALFNIFLNLLMIPSLSYTGASIATVLSELFLYFCFIYFINKQYKILNLYKDFKKPLIASLFMGIFVYLIEINLFLLILVGSFVYFIILTLLGTFTQEDKNILKHISIKRGNKYD